MPREVTPITKKKYLSGPKKNLARPPDTGKPTPAPRRRVGQDFIHHVAPESSAKKGVDRFFTRYPGKMFVLPGGRHGV